MKGYASALRENVSRWIKEVKDVNILVGIPCYNNEDTISHVVSTVAEGLRTYFPDKKSALFVSDGGSTDNTREKAYTAPVPEGFQRRVTIYRGMPGKGTSFRAVFELAMHLKADCCVVVDSDLRSITPEWIKLLAEPVMKGNAEFVAPYYIRHKNDGTITNNIIYPITRALYGLRMRQPIGGDFGFSGEMAVLYTKEDVWETDVAKFGIDIWMSTTAINAGIKVVQAQLGTKVHDAKDPSEHLAPMFRQVVSTLFYLMGKYESKWRNIKGSTPVDTLGEPKEMSKIEPVSVNFNKLEAELLEGFSHFDPLYKQIIEPENYNNLSKNVQKLKKTGKIMFPADLWAKILYDVAFTYQTWSRNKKKLIDIMVPLYFGRTAAYCHEVSGLDDEHAEKIVEDQAKIFESQKSYLVKKYEAWE
ncbi:MAG: glycosyltransferase [Candidatus Brocadiaceae bacterium]|nr:glycosyltransferase [Candidatus Brocadiaceae bacterium]